MKILFSFLTASNYFRLYGRISDESAKHFEFYVFGTHRTWLHRSNKHKFKKGLDTLNRFNYGENREKDIEGNR